MNHSDRKTLPLATALDADPDLKTRLKRHPKLRVLSIPVFGGLLARRLTLGKVSSLTGIPIEELTADVSPAGQPEMPNSNAVHIDVRSYLADGQSPLVPVMEAAKVIPPGGELVVDAPFDPVPLRNRVVELGFEADTQQIDEILWRIRFTRTAAQAPGRATPDTGPRIWQQDGETHIDVRNLEPPRPLVAICALLEASTTGDVVIVHHDREPHLLYPELEARAWHWEPLSAGPDGLDLRLTRGAAG